MLFAEYYFIFVVCILRKFYICVLKCLYFKMFLRTTLVLVAFMHFASCSMISSTQNRTKRAYVEDNVVSYQLFNSYWNLNHEYFDIKHISQKS